MKSSSPLRLEDIYRDFQAWCHKHGTDPESPGRSLGRDYLEYLHDTCSLNVLALVRTVQPLLARVPKSQAQTLPTVESGALDYIEALGEAALSKLTDQACAGDSPSSRSVDQAAHVYCFLVDAASPSRPPGHVRTYLNQTAAKSLSGEIYDQTYRDDLVQQTIDYCFESLLELWTRGAPALHKWDRAGLPATDIAVAAYLAELDSLESEKLRETAEALVTALLYRSRRRAHGPRTGPDGLKVVGPHLRKRLSSLDARPTRFFAWQDHLSLRGWMRLRLVGGEFRQNKNTYSASVLGAAADDRARVCALEDFHTDALALRRQSNADPTAHRAVAIEQFETIANSSELSAIFRAASSARRLTKSAASDLHLVFRLDVGLNFWSSTGSAADRIEQAARECGLPAVRIRKIMHRAARFSVIAKNAMDGLSIEEIARLFDWTVDYARGRWSASWRIVEEALEL